METVETKTEYYELGLHFWSKLEEAGSKEKFQEVVGVITDLGGVISTSREPHKQRLSYPIEHQRYSFMGTINFKFPSEAIEPLQAQLKLSEHVLRFLVLKTRENQRILKSLKESAPRAKIKTHTPPKPETKPQEEVKPEVMEKQLEEAIENL